VGRTRRKTLSSDGKSCDICTLPDLHTALRDRVAALCTRVFEAEEPAPAPPPVPVPPAPPPPALDVAPPTPAPAPEPAPASSTGRRIGQVGSVALAALGVAAAVYGGYLCTSTVRRRARPDKRPSVTSTMSPQDWRRLPWRRHRSRDRRRNLFYSFTW